MAIESGLPRMHGTFRQFVTDAKLEFFDAGGDPQELMSYMVRSAFVLFAPFPSEHKTRILSRFIGTNVCCAGCTF